MKRMSLVGAGAGRLDEERFFVARLLVWACLVSACVATGRCWPCLALVAGVRSERCSTLILCEPILPAARLTRDAPCATSAFRPGPTRSFCRLLSFLRLLLVPLPESLA